MGRGRRAFDRFERDAIKGKCTGCGKQIYLMSERDRANAKCVSCGFSELMTTTPAQWEAKRAAARKIDAARAAERKRRKKK